MNLIQLKRGLEADRLSLTPAPGEPLYVTDTKKFYIGDGVTPGGVSSSFTLPDQTGNTGKFLVTDGVTVAWESNTTAASGVHITQFDIVATKSVFDIIYTVDNIEVVHNGIQLAPSEYTAINGTSVTLNIAAENLDIVLIKKYTKLTIDATLSVDCGGAGSNGDAYFDCGTASSVG